MYVSQKVIIGSHSSVCHVLLAVTFHFSIEHGEGDSGESALTHIDVSHHCDLKRSAECGLSSQRDCKAKRAIKSRCVGFNTPILGAIFDRAANLRDICSSISARESPSCGYGRIMGQVTFVTSWG